MKSLLYTLLTALLLLISANMGAQKHFNPAKFNAGLQSYITKKARLTPSEANAFFPIYQEMNSKLRGMHTQLKALQRQRPRSENECLSYLHKQDKLNIQMKQTEQSYHLRMLKVVSASRLYSILEAERQYFRAAFKKAAQR